MAAPLAPLLAPLLRGIFQMLFARPTLARIMRLMRRVDKVTKDNWEVKVDTRQAQMDINAAFKSINGITKAAWAKAGELSQQFGAESSARLAMITPPMNNGLKKAEDILEGDIREIFVPLESIPFAELVMAKNWVAVASYNPTFTSKRLQQAFEKRKFNVLYNAFAYSQNRHKPFSGNVDIVPAPSVSLHNKARGPDFRPSGQKFYVQGQQAAAQAAIDGYVAGMKQKIGRMGGGWVLCYKKLKGKGYNFPSRMHSKGAGGVSFTKDKNSITLTCHNKYGNFNGYMQDRYGMFVTILTGEANKMSGKFNRFLIYESKKFIVK